MKNSLLLPLGLVLAGTSPALAATIGGIDFPDGAVSFADAVVSTDLGDGTTIPTGSNAGDPDQATGVPNNVGNENNFYTLGVGGSIVLRFIDNSLTGSGDADDDLHIFEIGGDVEDTIVEISQDNVTYLNVGNVNGSTSSIDIDPFLSAEGLGAFTQFSYVRLTDVFNEGQTNPSVDFAGADIDAVGAISSSAPAPAVPLPAGGLLLISGLTAAGWMRARRTRR